MTAGTGTSVATTPDTLPSDNNLTGTSPRSNSGEDAAAVTGSPDSSSAALSATINGAPAAGAERGQRKHQEGKKSHRSEEFSSSERFLEKDVIDILGVRFERWSEEEQKNSTTTATAVQTAGQSQPNGGESEQFTSSESSSTITANTSSAGFATSAAATSTAGNTERLENDNSARKRLLLYLPGIEGLGTSVEPQLPAMSEKFDVFRMIIGAEDRSTFSTLSRAVTEFVDRAGKEMDVDEKTVLVGESFGGMLGLRLGQLR